MNPLLMVALDGLADNEERDLQIARELSQVNGNFGFKVNLDYVLKHGLWVVGARIKAFGRPVFVDLKMWNGTRTMTSTIEGLVRIEVGYLNVYALADTLLPKAIQVTQDTETKVLGVTVLTHFSEEYCQRHFHRSLRDTVRHFAEVAIEAGCHGIILPGTALDVVADLETIKVVPGVRPTWYKDTRHEEEVEPKVAVENGANILVCGSPIMKADNPVGALKQILAEIA